MMKFTCLTLTLLTGCATHIETPKSTESNETSTEEDKTNQEENNDNSGFSPQEEEEEEGCPDSWVLTYSLEGRIDITHTPLNIGNADALVGGLDSDELVLRVADNNGVPSDGLILITYFNLLQDFRDSVNMPVSYTHLPLPKKRKV